MDGMRHSKETILEQAPATATFQPTLQVMPHLAGLQELRITVAPLALEWEE